MIAIAEDAMARSVKLENWQRARKNLEKLGALRLLQAICAEHFVAEDELLGTSHSPRIVRARHEMWHLLKDSLGLSYPETGNVFLVDHSSVISAVAKRRDAHTHG